MLAMPRKDLILFLGFSAAVLAMPIWLQPFGAAYPDLLNRFAIFAILAVGFNILFGLTGYLSFGHAAFFGVGSYAAVWSFKLFTMDALPALVFAVVISGVFALAIGFVSLRRSGIYFSILTLAFAQMSYNLAYSVFTPITNGETGLQLSLNDKRFVDRMFFEAAPGLPSPSILGVPLNGYIAFYFCAFFLILTFFIAQRITGSPFGMMLKGIKSNQVRMNYTGVNTRPYTLAAFVISGMFAGLAGGLLAITDPLAGAERMQWTASGEVVLMTILGGAGTLVGPVIGAWMIKYFENIFSALNDNILAQFWSFLPNGLDQVAVAVSGKFVGDGWFLTLGLVFVLIVVFLPGGVMEGVRRIASLVTPKRPPPASPTKPSPQPQPAE
ncbi:MAG: branched-chain amino acid ABC transporter permease [Devosia sp.]